MTEPVTNIYDLLFEEYLVFDLGYDLDKISMKDCIKEMNEFNKINKYIDDKISISK